MPRIEDVKWKRDAREGQPTYITIGGRGVTRIYEIRESDAAAVIQALAEANAATIARCESTITAHGIRCELVKGHHGMHSHKGSLWSDRHAV